MFRKRRRSKKREAEAVGSLIMIVIVLGIIGAIFQAIGAAAIAVMNFLSTTNGKIFLAIAVCAAVALVVKKIKHSKLRKQEHANQLATETKQLEERQRAINNVSPSTNREDYIFEKDDYKRGSPKENFYRKTFSLRLIEIFGNSCAKCGSKENGVDLDHFIFSKNEGGCFIMKHNDGHLVNNAIPLCQTCNRSKSDEHYKSFFSDSELLSIFEKNLLMTKLLNERDIFCDEGKIIKTRKAANG